MLELRDAAAREVAAAPAVAPPPSPAPSPAHPAQAAAAPSAASFAAPPPWGPTQPEQAGSLLWRKSTALLTVIKVELLVFQVYCGTYCPKEGIEPPRVNDGQREGYPAIGLPQRG